MLYQLSQAGRIRFFNLIVSILNKTFLSQVIRSFGTPCLPLGFASLAQPPRVEHAKSYAFASWPRMAFTPLRGQTRARLRPASLELPDRAAGLTGSVAGRRRMLSKAEHASYGYVPATAQLR